MLKTQTAKDAGVKIWQKPHQGGESLTDTMQLSMDNTWMIYSLTEKEGFEQTDQAPGWELYLFDFKSERSAFIAGMDRLRPMGPVPNIKDTLVVAGKVKQGLFMAFESYADYIEFVESFGGDDGDLIVREYIETQ